MPQKIDSQGNIWEVGSGKPVYVGNVRQSGPPADPTFPYQGAKASADARSAGANAQVDVSTINAQINKANADAAAAAAQARLAEANAAQAESDTVKQTSEMREKALKGFQDTKLLDQAIREIEARYAKGPGSTSGVWGVKDWMGGPENKAFDSAGSSVRAVVKGVLGFTGQELNTPAESQQSLGPYIPQAGDWDTDIEGKIDRLKRLRDSGYERSVQSLGGIPDARGNVTPLPEGLPPNALTIGRIVNGEGPSGAGFGATKKQADIPSAMQTENMAWMSQNLNSLDPDAYAAFRSELDRKYGFTPDPEAYRAWAVDAKKSLSQGGQIDPTISGPEQDMTTTEWLRNSAVDNPVGASAAGFADGMSFGGVKALAGDKMAALDKDHGTAMMLGEIGGAIGGTSAIGKFGKEAVVRALPTKQALALLKGGGWKGRLARNLATDMTYGAGYGGVTEGDPVNGAAFAALGSAGGQLGGKIIGKALGGVKLSAAAQALRDAGVDLTGGRALGPLASRIEDKAASLPIIGDMIQNRQGDAFRQFNKAAFDEAGRPIGFQPTAIGQEGIDQFGNAVSGAYDKATAGVDVPLDEQFLADLKAATDRGMRLPPDLRRGLGDVLDARVQPIADEGKLTGTAYQQAMRALKATRSNPPQRFQGFEQDYRGSVSDAMQALRGQMERGGGRDVIEGLAAADAANKGFKTLENASLDRAKIGTQAGETEVFVPSQLLAAARASEKKYGANALKRLARQAQEVLPSKVPNSGTTDRMIINGLGLAALGGGGVSDATLGTNISPWAAALTAALAMGGTKGGQKLITAMLADRPKIARRLGEGVGRRAGLFGSASLPLVLGN